MGTRPPHPCGWPGCRTLTGDRFCDTHRRADQRRLDARRPSSSARGYDARWRHIRAEVLARDPWCSKCRERPAEEVHHVVALRDGGTNAPENLAALCKSCHSGLTMTATRAAGSDA